MNTYKGILFAILSFFCIAICYAQTETTQFKFSEELAPRYVGEINIGYGTTTTVLGANAYCGRASIGTIQGVGFGKYGSVGLGVDANMYTHYYSGQGLRFSLNTFVDIRPTYPITDNFSVFLDLGLGVCIPVINMEGNKSSFFCQFAPGIKHKRLVFSCGLQNFGAGSSSLSTFFAKIGLYLGK